jgi:hypothetical protein
MLYPQIVASENTYTDLLVPPGLLIQQNNISFAAGRSLQGERDGDFSSVKEQRKMVLAQIGAPIFLRASPW